MERRRSWIGKNGWHCCCRWVWSARLGARGRLQARTQVHKRKVALPLAGLGRAVLPRGLKLKEQRQLAVQRQPERLASVRSAFQPSSVLPQPSALPRPRPVEAEGVVMARLPEQLAPPVLPALTNSFKQEGDEAWQVRGCSRSGKGSGFFGRCCWSVGSAAVLWRLAW